MRVDDISLASRPWQDTADRKTQQDLNKIPVSWRLPRHVIEQAKETRNISDGFIEGLLDDETRQITSLEVPVLMEMTASGVLSAVSLTIAFCKRAAYGHQLNKNLLEIGFEQAISRAESLDKHWETHQRPVGPLHGLPITMKDQFHVKGMDTTMAYVGWIDTFEGNKQSPLKRSTESEIVRELESLGAIIIAKASPSTLVQTLAFPETNNNILGYHLNPRNQQLSSGGSSGGEGGVQALRGSAIGIGSDNGGSVSIPAACNGVYSIKPSAGRLSFLNVADSSPGQNSIPTVPGILGSSVASLKYFFKSLLSSQPWLHDTAVVPLPWREQHDLGDRKLSFGFMEFDGIVKPHPPVQRGLRIISEALRASGHELVPWCPPTHARALAIHATLSMANGGYDVFENLALSGEPLIPQLKEDYPDGKPNSPSNAIEIEKAVQLLTEYKAEYHHYWMSSAEATSTGRPVDAIILPIWASAALIPGNPFYPNYIAAANVLNHTTMVVPVTRADINEDRFDHGYSPVGDQDEEIWQSYDPQKYHGAPVAIQLQCECLEEEKLLAVGQIVVDALSDYQRGNQA